MTFGNVTAEQITSLNFGDVALQLERINGDQGGKVDTTTLQQCANRLNELTRNRNMFLSKRYEPLRKILRIGFESAGINVGKDSHLYDVSRRLMKNIRGATHIKGELRTKACSVCSKIDEIVSSPEGQQYFPN